jgi:hypothetical protein
MPDAPRGLTPVAAALPAAVLAGWDLGPDERAALDAAVRQWSKVDVGDSGAGAVCTYVRQEGLGDDRRRRRRHENEIG